MCCKECILALEDNATVISDSDIGFYRRTILWAVNRTLHAFWMRQSCTPDRMELINLKEDDMTAPANNPRKPGDLDTPFAENGMIDVAEGASRLVAETSTGDLLYVAHKGMNSCGIYRAKFNGSPDAEFTPFEWQFAQDMFERPSCLLARDDGKFMVIGDTGGEPFTRQTAISRFNESGSPDLIFGTKIFPSAVDPVPPGQLVQTDPPTGCLTADKHVWVGASYRLSDSDGFVIDSAGHLYCLNDQGETDKSVNGTGMIEVRFNGLMTNVLSVAVLPDGRIVVFGIVDRPSEGQSHSRAALVCYNRDGTLNRTFCKDGFWENNDYSYFGEMVVDNGKIIFVTITVIDHLRHIAMYRLLGDGTLDPSFNNAKALLINLEANFLGVPSIAIQPDKKIVVAGSCDFPDEQMYWLRVNESGVLDSTFGDLGVVLQQVGTVSDVTVQRTGSRILVAANLGPSGGTRDPKILGVQS